MNETKGDLSWSDLVLRFRYYLGRKPVVVVADPDLLRQVMVKDFSSFPNRMVRTFSQSGSDLRMWAGLMGDHPPVPSLCADSALRHQTHGGLFAGAEERAVEASEEHHDSVLQRCQDERSETRIWVRLSKFCSICAFWRKSRANTASWCQQMSFSLFSKCL